MNMSLRAKYRRRVLQNSLVIATTVLSCTALRADHEDQDKSASQGAPGQYERGEKGDRQGNKTQHFIKEAAMGGQMEVQMGQLGQQNAQNAEVKSLAAALVRDHTEANQKLQQLAQQKGITLEQSSDAKHQKHLESLQSKSGAEFDKAFVTEAIRDHKKDIAQFEKCQKEEKDADVKAFIDQTLPTLRNHLQMAQNAARAIGVDANVAADIGTEANTGEGAPAAGVSGTTEEPSRGGKLNERNSSQQSKSNSSDQSSLNNSSSSGASASGTIGTSSSSTRPQSSTSSDQTAPSASVQGNVGDHSFSANAGVNSSDTTTSSSTDSSVRSDLNTDTSSGNKAFKKGDNKVLGLSTDKHDGKFLGIIPDPRSKSRSSASTGASTSSDVSSTTASSDTSIGGPATTSTGTSSSERVEWSSAPSQVKQALQAEGADTSTSLKKLTVYEADVNGKKIHVTEDGRVYKHDQTGSSNR